MKKARKLFSEKNNNNSSSPLLEQIKQHTVNCNDLVIREIRIGSASYFLLFIEEFIEKELIEERIIDPLLKINEVNEINLSDIKDRILPLSQIILTDDIHQALTKLFSGNTLLLREANWQILIIDTTKIAERAVSDPATETVVRGARDAFTENIKTNISLIRKRIKNSQLKVETQVLGARTNTEIALMYMDEIVLPDLLQEVKKRLSKINIDSILESGYIEQLIEDQTFSPFPQILYTERPDKAASSVLEGRIAIVIDGTPLVLIVPAVFNEFFISSEDYYERFFYGSFIRFFRFLASFIGLFSSALYIAFSSYHPDLLPTKLALAIGAGRVGVPFPPIMEILLMDFTAEILREASIRLPGQIGPTLSIVGALVLGEAAVSAGLVSPTLIIVIALTTIGNIATPNYSAGASLRLLRFYFIFMSVFLGLYGLVMGVLILLTHLLSLKSFGVPYLAPYAPMRIKDLKDTLIRLPIQYLITRPRYLRPLDKIRQQKGKNKQ